MTAQGLNEKRVKRITAILIQDGQYGPFSIDQALANVDSTSLLKNAVRSKDSMECLNCAVKIMEATNKAVEEFAQQIAMQERDQSELMLMQFQNDLGHGVDHYLS